MDDAAPNILRFEILMDSKTPADLLSQQEFLKQRFAFAAHPPVGSCGTGADRRIPSGRKKADV